MTDLRLLLALPALMGCGPFCDVHEDCFDDEVCAYGKCRDPAQMRWDVTIDDAVVEDVHPDGNPWDDDSPPDLLVIFGFDDFQTCETSVIFDAFHPRWDQSCRFDRPYDAPFFLALWDQDGSQFELGAEWTFDALGFVDLARFDGDLLDAVDETETVRVGFALTPVP